MPIPPWIYSAPAEPSIPLTVSADIKGLDGKTIYLTDARGSGILLRDNRLTLRNVSALSEFVIHFLDENNFTLESIETGQYVSTADKGAFFAKFNAEEASKQPFSSSVTDVGIELRFADGRPGVFDDNYDLSVGKWQKGRSRIPIVIHVAEQGLPAVWPRQIGGTPSKSGALSNKGEIF